MGWIYKYIEAGRNNAGTIEHWAVGYYVGDYLEIISYFSAESDAIARVSLLNGGN